MELEAFDAARADLLLHESGHAEYAATQPRLPSRLATAASPQPPRHQPPRHLPRLLKPSPPRSSPTPRLLVHRWRRLIGFDSFDENGDGDLTPDEVKAGIEKVVAKMDSNGDGLISRDELSAHVQKMGGELELIEQLIKTIDTDGDGMISKAELMGLSY